jgi:GMP synthase (glutamine-hydrolysing)
LRAVTSTDGMTADFYQFDMKFLAETVTRIINISSVRMPMISP